MSASDNTPTVIVSGKDTPKTMSDTGGAEASCKFCNGDSGLKLVATLPNDSGSEGAGEEIEPESVMWLCEGHHIKILKSDNYRVREIPNEDIELGHTTRDEVSEENEEYVTILEEENENKWLKVPNNLETDLKEKR